MAITLLYQTWSGGSGIGDRADHILECKEDPIEVLKVFYRTHEIYSYQSLRNPVDNSYPNNVQGLVIREMPQGYLNEIVSQKGLSIHDIDPAQITGILKSPIEDKAVFEKSLMQIVNNRLYYHKKELSNTEFPKLEDLFKKYEKDLKSLLDVASVTLSINSSEELYNFCKSRAVATV